MARAKILANKNVCANDPYFKSMNDTQILFEFEALNDKEEKRYNDTVTIMKYTKKMLVNLLGLNMMPIEEEDGRLRLPNDDEVTPMLIAIAREDYAKMLYESLMDYSEQVKADEAPELEMTLEEAEAFMKDDESDIDFEPGVTSSGYREKLIKMDDEFLYKTGVIKLIKQEGVKEAEKEPVTIEASPVEDIVPVKKRPKVVIESIK